KTVPMFNEALAELNKIVSRKVKSFSLVLNALQAKR
ncbi:30S ribosomal S2 domain protein, partial [Shigella flexneri 1235-66]